MNIEIAKNRYSSVLNVDVISNSQEDFLATHVPVKNLIVSDHFHLNSEDMKKTLSEKEVYDRLIVPNDQDQFVLVVGESGSGKSHLIRWFDAKMESNKTEDETVLFIRRYDNTLKGTIRQLLSMPEVKNIENKEVYDRLCNSNIVVDEKELKNTIYHNYLIKIESDVEKGGASYGLPHYYKKAFSALMANSEFKDKIIMKDDGPIDRIYEKIAENRSKVINEENAEFKESDFDIDYDLYNAICTYGDRLATSALKKIYSNDEKGDEIKHDICNYLNSFSDSVIQNCIGLEPGDLREVFMDIRKELYREGKNLTLFIEDVTSLTGINAALIDCLTTTNTGMNENEHLCRINSVLGCTNGYFQDKFPDNYKQRVTYFITVQSSIFDNNKSELVEFFAKYLNTVSLPESVLTDWKNNGAREDEYPIHEVTSGDGWDYYTLANGRKINLFPFTKHAITNLYKRQKPNERTPRFLIRDIIQKFVIQALSDLEHFPDAKISIDKNPTLSTRIMNSTGGISEADKYRLRDFMYAWGDGTNNVTIHNKLKCIGGIPECVYQQLNLPIVEGELKTEEENVQDDSESEDAIPVPDETDKKTSAKVQKIMNIVDQWINDKGKSINVSSNVGETRILKEAKAMINNFIFQSIDWQNEGLSNNLVNKTITNNIVTLERQTKKDTALITLPANTETRGLIEAGVRWSIEGNESWNFPGANDNILRLEIWLEKNKKKIIDEVRFYRGADGKKYEAAYFKYAAAAEYLRIIVNGHLTTYTSPSNLPEYMPFNSECNDLNSEPKEEMDTFHTKEWKSFRQTLNTSNGNAEEARKVVLSYYNLIQGDVKTNSKVYTINEAEYLKAVRAVFSHGLIYKENELQLDDPFKNRKIFSEYLNRITSLIPGVIEVEKANISEMLNYLRNEINFENDISKQVKSLCSSIMSMYHYMDSCGISASLDSDQKTPGECKNHADKIASAINTAVDIEKSDDEIRSLLLLSRNPLYWLTKFTNVVKEANQIIDQGKDQIDAKLSQIEGDSNKEFTDEQEQRNAYLNTCEQIISEVFDHAD